MRVFFPLLLVGFSVAITSLAQQFIEETDNGILISTGANQSVIFNGPLNLTSGQQNVTLSVTVVNELLQNIKDLQAQLQAANVSALQQNIRDLQSQMKTLRDDVNNNVLSSCSFGWIGLNCSRYIGACGLYDSSGTIRTKSQQQAVLKCHPLAECVDTSYNGKFSCICPQNRTGVYCESSLVPLQSCSHILSAAAPFISSSAFPDGIYTLDIDGNGPVQPANYYCDMTTNGGGWTIFASYTGGDGELPFVSNTAGGGNPLTFQYYNTDQTMKQSLSTQNGQYVDGRGETLLKRKDGTWLTTSSPAFNGYLKTNIHQYGLAVTTQSVIITANDGTRAAAVQGYSSSGIIGGGDFGIVAAEYAFDFHDTVQFSMLTSYCYRMYFYSYSVIVQDSDAGYDVNLPLGSWNTSDPRNVFETGHLSLYAAIRDPTLFGTCSSNPCRNNATCVNHDLSSAGYQCLCQWNYTGHHCEITLCPPLATYSFNGKCFVAIKDGAPRNWTTANSVCQNKPGSLSLASPRGTPGFNNPESVLLVDTIANVATQRVILGAYGILLNQYYFVDGSNNNIFGTLLPFQTGYPQLSIPATPTNRNWPVIFLNGGTTGTANRYLAKDFAPTTVFTDPFVCSVFQQPKGYCKNMNETYWQGSCYFYGVETLYRSPAEAKCQARGSHLVTVDSMGEQAFLITRFTPMTQTWIGLYSPYNNLTYVWTSGSNSTFRYWDNLVSNFLQPDASGPCVRMTNTKTATLPWDDVSCITATEAYICERPADPYNY